MRKFILPLAWRLAIRDFNADYLATKKDRRCLAWNLAALALIFAGLYFGAWIWAPVP